LVFSNHKPTRCQKCRNNYCLYVTTCQCAPGIVHVLEGRRVWRYQSGNQNPYIEEEQTTQWPNEKVQKDKQRSTKHTHKTKERVTRTPLQSGGELRCSWRVSSFCSISGTRRINIVTNSVISHEWGNVTTWHRVSFMF